MFITRRVLLKNKLFANFICTSNTLNCKKPKDETDAEKGPKVKQKTAEKVLEKNKISNFKEDITETMYQVIFDEKPTHKKQKKYHLGITKQAVTNVAKELKGDVKEISKEIFGYLKEMEVSDRPKIFKMDSDDKTLGSSWGSGSLSLMKNYSKTDESKIVETKAQVKLKIWDDLEAEELMYLGKKSPSNCYEEMIAWTEEGKLWRFPIDNDQGMEEEAKISFTEHVFLEQYLEPWCPKRGPLRKFMELVLIGLSKNYLYTLQEKKNHIDWFRKYFEEKKKLLQELGAMGSAKDTKEIGVSKAEEKS